MQAGVTSALFRPEVAEARHQRVFGEIVLTQPAGSRVLVTLLFGIIAALALWVTLGTYTRTETARGILVTDAASAKVVAARPGVVTHLSVREEQFVRAGQTIATVRTEQGDETGGSAVEDSLGALEAQRGLTREQMRLAAERAAGERARVAATLAGLTQQRSDLAAQIALQEEAVASAKDLFDRIQSVLDKGFVTACGSMWTAGRLGQ